MNKIEPFNKLKITVEFLDGAPLKGSARENDVIALLVKSGMVDQIDGKYQMMYHYQKKENGEKHYSNISTGSNRST